MELLAEMERYSVPVEVMGAVAKPFLEAEQSSFDLEQTDKEAVAQFLVRYKQKK